MNNGMRQIADLMAKRGNPGTGTGVPGEFNMGHRQGQTYYPVVPLGPYSGPAGMDSPRPNANAYAHANPHAAFMRPQFPGDAPPAGGQGNHYGWADTLISALPQPRQDRMTQMWGMFGGGAPMPATVGDFRTARRDWRHANPGQWPRWPGR